MKKLSLSFTTIFAICLLASIAIAGAAIFVSSIITINGNIQTSANLEIYNDAACTIKTTGTSLGTVTLGSTVTHDYYLKNIGNSPLVLTMTTLNWNPVNHSFLTLTWNKENANVVSGSITPITLTLVTASNAPSVPFNVDVKITGTATTTYLAPLQENYPTNISQPFPPLFVAIVIIITVVILSMVYVNKKNKR
jgi:hypothetical protein